MNTVKSPITGLFEDIASALILGLVVIAAIVGIAAWYEHRLDHECVVSIAFVSDGCLTDANHGSDR